MHKRIISAAKRVESVSEGMLYAILRVAGVYVGY
jgi:hypothetical protein